MKPWDKEWEPVNMKRMCYNINQNVTFFDLFAAECYSCWAWGTTSKKRVQSKLIKLSIKFAVRFASCSMATPFYSQICCLWIKINCFHRRSDTVRSVFTVLMINFPCLNYPTHLNNILRLRHYFHDALPQYKTWIIIKQHINW